MGDRDEYTMTIFFGKCPLVKVKDIDDIVAANHVIWKLKVEIEEGKIETHDHHFIVKGVKYEKNILKLTGFDSPLEEDGLKAKVVTRKINYADVEGSLYKVIYKKGFTMNKGAVLRRAQEVEENYPEMQNSVTLEDKLVFENCKQFAEYCKVGPVMNENLAKSIYGVIANVIKDTVTIVLVNQAGMVESTKVLAASALVGILIEAIINAHDIYRFYQMMMDGRIDQDQFIELLVERLVMALCAQMGSLSGFCVGGMPGYLIGGILGNIFGKVFGKIATGYVIKFGASVVHFFENLIQELKKGVGGFLPGANHFHND